jgi:glycerophosphoryl diester phosphodiesterase
MKDVGSTGIDSLDDIKQIPDGFAGYVWTNRIELIGPELRKQGR